MKSIVLAAAITLFLFSCKKEGGGHQKETFLSQISINGLKQLSFDYNSDNLLSKIEAFNTDPADNSLSSYIVFQFNDKKQITQFTSYMMPGNVAVGKATIQYDEEGRLVSGTSYDLQGIAPNTPNSTTTFTYNAKGLVIKITEKNKSGKTTQQRNLLYYDDGHIKEQQSWSPTGDQLYMTYKVSYSIPNGFYPNGLEQMRVLLGADFIASLYSETISHVNYTQNGDITKHWNEQMSAREFNEDGTLKKQVSTRKYILPEFDDDVSIEEYTYMKR
jgi:hypothetical protein